jgi:hypothetical protein
MISRTAGWIYASLFVLGAGTAGCPQCAASPNRPASTEAGATSFIPFDDGKPASLVWSARSESLFVADNENNQIWRWTDGQGLVRAATTADPVGAAKAQGALVGQIQELSDGTLVVMRFGHPKKGFGAIAYVNPRTRQSGLVPNIDQQRKRLGLALGANDTLYGSYFEDVSGAGGEVQGALTIVDLQNGERDYAGGFKKIAGIVVRDGTIYVSDQRADTIYALHEGPMAPEGPPYEVFASVPAPDQLCAGPDGSLFTGQFKPGKNKDEPFAVRWIRRDGTVSILARAPEVTRPTGCAFDPDRRRLFVADSGDPKRTGVHIFVIP